MGTLKARFLLASSHYYDYDHSALVFLVAGLPSVTPPPSARHPSDDPSLRSSMPFPGDDDQFRSIGSDTADDPEDVFVSADA